VTTLNLNWHLSKNCPYLSIQQCGHVQHKHRTVNTPTMCHISSQNPHTSDHIRHYATLRHFQDGLQTLIQFTFYVCQTKGVPLLLQTNKQTVRFETQETFCTPKVNCARNMLMQFVSVTLLRFCSSQLTRIHYITNPRAGSVGPTFIAVRSMV